MKKGITGITNKSKDARCISVNVAMPKLDFLPFIIVNMFFI